MEVVTMLLTNFDKHKALGIMLLRVLFGLLILSHGYPKIIHGNVEYWSKLGSAMSFVGIAFGYVFWGLLSSVTEFFGGLLLLAGFLVRPTSIFLTINMLVAIAMKLGSGGGLSGAEAPFIYLAVFLPMIILGAGSFSVDEYLDGRRRLSRQAKH